VDEPQNQGSREGVSAARARLIGAFAALAAGAAAVVFGVTLVRGLPAIASTASTSLATSGAESPAAPTVSATRRFPAPPRGALVIGASSGAKALGLSVLATERSGSRRPSSAGWESPRRVYRCASR
jgi:hypothetical protein